MDPVPLSIADGIDRQLDPRYIPLERIRNVILTAVLAAVSFAGMIAVWVAVGRLLAGLLLVPMWLLLIGLLAWHLQRWPGIAYRYAAYRVDELGLEIRRGVFWRAVTNVPRSRVQHTDVSQGPLERRFGLGTLVVHTAGTANAEVKLEGLDHGVARSIRAHLLPGDDGDAV